MGRKLTPEPPIFFVCGTPSDRHGFEWKELDGRRLSFQPTKYLDIIPKEKLPKRNKPTHALFRTATAGSEAAVYAEYRWIQPNDTRRNRGAYIAVGYWAETPLALVETVEALHRIEAIHEDLAGRRDPDSGAFPRDFQLHAYTPSPVGGYRGQLAGLLCRAATATENAGGELVLTSEEIEQGKLAKFVTRAEAPNLKSPRPAAAGNRSWHDFAQKTIDEAPQVRRELRKLIHLEEEREKTIKVLARTVNNTPRQAPRTDRGSGFMGREILLPAIVGIAALAIFAAVIIVLTRV